MKGKVFCIGVGPGDPEMLTLKAVRIIRECGMIALPNKDPNKSTAYNIAIQAVPEISQKQLIGLDMPMIKDRTVLEKAHRKSADMMEKYLDAGENVAFLTLGDPTIFCTFGYINRLLQSDGYQTELVSGVPSFCAAAAKLNISLAEWNEQLHILPALHVNSDDLSDDGNYILMKPASRIDEVRQMLIDSGMSVCAVENCGMKDEHIYHSAEELPNDAGYFTLIIAKNKPSFFDSTK